jgi:hypothetical protein
MAILTHKISDLTAGTPPLQDTDLFESQRSTEASKKWAATELAAYTLAYDADIAAVAALATQAYGRSLLTTASEAALKALINLEIGTDVQAASANLTTLAAVAPGTTGLALLDDATPAAARTTISAQLQDAGLDALAALGATAGLIEKTTTDTYTERLIGAANATDVPTRADGDARWAQLAAVNAFTAALSITVTGATSLTITSTDAGASAAPILVLDRNSASPAANDILADIVMSGRSSTGVTRNYIALIAQILDHTNASEDGNLIIQAMIAGAATNELQIGGGLLVGAATGGKKGVGSINVAADIYKNNAAYTNPDFVFEHAFTGKILKFRKSEGAADYKGLLPLAKLEGYVKANLRLPGIGKESMGAFQRTDKALEKIEELSLYVIELHKRLASLEGRKK